MTYPDIFRDISKLTKTDRISRDNSNCDLSRDIARQVSLSRLIPACCFTQLKKCMEKNDRLVAAGVSRVWSG